MAERSGQTGQGGGHQPHLHFLLSLLHPFLCAFTEALIQISLSQTLLLEHPQLCSLPSPQTPACSPSRGRCPPWWVSAPHSASATWRCSWKSKRKNTLRALGDGSIFVTMAQALLRISWHEVLLGRATQGYR